MVHFELYDPTKTYYFRSNKKATPELLKREYPILGEGYPVIVDTDVSHIYFGGYELLSNACDRYGIETEDKTDEELLAAIIEVANAPQPEPEYEPSPEERIAAALEYQNLMTMPVIED